MEIIMERLTASAGQGEGNRILLVGIVWISFDLFGYKDPFSLIETRSQRVFLSVLEEKPAQYEVVKLLGGPPQEWELLFFSQFSTSSRSCTSKFGIKGGGIRGHWDFFLYDECRRQAWSGRWVECARGCSFSFWSICAAEFGEPATTRHSIPHDAGSNPLPVLPAGCPRRNEENGLEGKEKNE